MSLVLIAFVATSAASMAGFGVGVVTGLEGAAPIGGALMLLLLAHAASFAPTESPERMAERAAYAQIAGIWGAALADSLSCQDHPVPLARPRHIGEDEADRMQRAWLEVARAVDVTP